MQNARSMRIQKSAGLRGGAQPEFANTRRLGLQVKNIRLFQCSCHHPLRFGAKSCSYCFKPAPFYNRIPFWVVVLLLVLFLGLEISGFGINETLQAIEGASK